MGAMITDYPLLQCSSLSNNSNGIVNIFFSPKEKKNKNNHFNTVADCQNKKINKLYIVTELHLCVYVYLNILLWDKMKQK